MANLISSTGWTTGGPGTASAADTISLTGTGAATTYARQSFPTIVGQRYLLSFRVDTASVLPERSIGTTAGGGELVVTATARSGSNARQFVATSETTWVQFQRTASDTATISAISVESVSRVGRSLNGTSNYFTLDVVAAGLRTANSNWYVGGWFRFNSAPVGGVYLADFGTLTPSGGGSAGRVRLVAEVGASAKVFCSSVQSNNTNYRECATTAAVSVGSWYYVGVIAQANADIQLVWGASQPSARTGTVPALDATGVCQRLHLGARATAPVVGFAPAVLSDWIWCSDFIPTTPQLQALAGGTRPMELAGFTPSYAWAMDHADNFEPSLASFANLGAVGSPQPTFDPGAAAPTDSTDPLAVIFI